MFVDFGDMNCRGVGNETVAQEWLQGKELFERSRLAEVEKEAFVAELLSMGTQLTFSATLLNDLPGAFRIVDHLIHEILLHWKRFVPLCMSLDNLNLKGNPIFSSHP